MRCVPDRERRLAQPLRPQNAANVACRSTTPVHRRRLLFLCLLTAVVGAGCAGTPAGTSTRTTPASVTGVVVDVSSQGLGKVTGFVLKDGDRSYKITIDPEVDYSFPLDHLNEHRATGAPVQVKLDQQRGDAMVALSIEDA